MSDANKENCSNCRYSEKKDNEYVKCTKMKCKTFATCWCMYYEPKTETVNHPSHYNQGKYEVIDVIEDWNLNFNLGNAVKYIARSEYKEKKEEDLKKAIWYLQRELQKQK